MQNYKSSLPGLSHSCYELAKHMIRCSIFSMILVICSYSRCHSCVLMLGVFNLSPTDVTLRSGVKVVPRPKKPTGHSLINPSSKRYSGLSFCHHADKFLDSDFCFPLLIQEKSSHRSGIRGQLAQLAPLLQYTMIFHLTISIH